MEWKSFADEKPEIGSRVFICTYFDRYNIDVNLTQSHIIPTVWGTGGKLATHWMSIPEPPKPKRTYPAPKVGTIVTEENIDEFIEKFSIWLLNQGLHNSVFLKDNYACFVSFTSIREKPWLPYQVSRVEDTDEIIWNQEEL